MAGDPGGGATREQRLDEATAAIMLEVEAGRVPDRAAVAARYPDLADELGAYLDHLRWLNEAIAGTPASTAPQPSATVDACPHCHARIDRGPGGSTCSGCGAVFRPEDDGDGAGPARRVGRFELTAVAGRGSFGTVWKAWDPEMNRVVAVKVPHRGTLAGPVDVERFMGDARLPVQLRHPHIVRVYEVGSDGGVPFLVSEFVPGRTLADLLAERRPGPAEAAGLLAKVADALDHAHKKGVVHRDVKPSNILVTAAGEPVLTDFGLAHVDGAEFTLTREGEVLGTVAYMSPEQARGVAKGLDGRSDVYSLGVVLYHLLTGEKPFVGAVEMVRAQILADDPRPPRRLNDRLPPDLETICLQCLRKEPARRYQTAAALAADLRRFLAGEPIHARPVGRFERLVRWVRRNPALAVAGGVVAVLLAATTVVSTAWALDSERKSKEVRRALDEAKRVTAETELDRGIAEAERGDVGLGMLWMARSLETLPAGADDLEWTIRVNLDAWQKHLLVLTDCVEPPPGRVMAFSPDGRLAWFVGADGRTVRPWDVGEARVVGPVLRHPAEVQGIAASPDGRRVACIVQGGGVRVWDAVSGANEPVPGETAPTTGITYSRDGRLLLAGSRSGRTVLEAWDGSALRRLPGAVDRSGLVSMAPEPDGGSLLIAAATCIDKGVHRWNAVDGRPDGSLFDHPGVPGLVAVSPDGRTAATACDAPPTVRLWDMRSGHLIGVLPHRTRVTALGFSPAGALLTACEEDAVRVWACPGRDDTGPARLHTRSIRALAVSPDGTLVATGSDDREVRLWAMTSGRPERAGPPLPHPSPVHAIAFSPDGATLATSTHLHDGVQLWDVATRRKGLRLEHPDRVHQVSFGPDGRLAATAAFDGKVWVWEVATGRAIWPQPVAHAGTVWVAVISPTGRVLLTAGNDRRVCRWDVATGTSLGPPLPHDGVIRAAAFNPADPRIFLAAGDDGIGRVWNVETGELVGQLTHGRAITVAGFTPDGRAAITGGHDGITRVWDATTGREIERSLRHHGRVRAVAVSRDGRWTVTASEDGSSRLWAVRNGRPIGRAVRHELAALCAVIDPFDRWVLTSGMDTAVHTRPAPAEAVGPSGFIAARIAVVVGGRLDAGGDLVPLTPDEWRRQRTAQEGPTGRTRP